ncbi:MAG: folate-binding protein [Alphaproteobacteria bacterium]
MALRFAVLPSRSVIRVSGEEAKTFLQGLISNDIEKIGERSAIFAALLSAQGKIQFDFIVLSDHHGGYLLDIEASRRDELIRKLKLYRLRAKVAIEPVVMDIVAVFGDRTNAQLPKPPLMIDDPRHAQLGLRAYGQSDDLRAELLVSSAIEASEDGYDADRIALGVPQGASELGIEKLFLLEANAEELHGVDFKKGCYVGQELTSRMKRKAELKKRLLPFHVSSGPAPDAHVTADGRELGNVVGGRSGIAFALVRLDRLAEANHATIKIGDTPAVLAVPAYLASVL